MSNNFQFPDLPSNSTIKTLKTTNGIEIIHVKEYRLLFFFILALFLLPLIIFGHQFLVNTQFTQTASLHLIISLVALLLFIGFMFLFLNPTKNSEHLIFDKSAFTHIQKKRFTSKKSNYDYSSINAIDLLNQNIERAENYHVNLKSNAGNFRVFNQANNDEKKWIYNILNSIISAK